MKKLFALSLFTLGSFLVCHAQEIPSDTTNFKLKEVYRGIGPLYVLNGEIVDKEKFDATKPETIEKVEVLKGESATRAYGEMGKNGVVIISLKGPKKQGKKTGS